MSSPARRKELQAEREIEQERRSREQWAAEKTRLELIDGIKNELANGDLATILADMLTDPAAFIREHT